MKPFSAFRSPPRLSPYVLSWICATKRNHESPVLRSGPDLVGAEPYCMQPPCSLPSNAQRQNKMHTSDVHMGVCNAEINQRLTYHIVNALIHGQHSTRSSVPVLNSHTA